MIKKTTEIDAILLNLNKAIDAHYQWLVSMFHSVVARDASKPEITDNHSYGLCQFGRWIDHLGPLDNDELPYVRLMDSAHQHMHNCGRELMLAIVENHWQDAHFDAFQEGLLSFTAALTDYKIYLLTIRSSMDVLTGLPGRRVLDESFDHQLRNAEPLNLYLMLLDIDRFKLVNDTYGHLIGDVVLRTLATYLASWTRDYETVYRYGGEEFIIIVKATNDEEACRAGVRICVVKERYNPAQWNIYAAQASDGDNWADDSPLCHEILAKKILPVVRYYSYIEITRRAHQTLWREYEHLQSTFDNFAMQHIRDQDDIYPVFRELFHKQNATAKD